MFDPMNNHISHAFAPLLIESDTDALRRDAQTKHEAWLTDGSNADKKATFAAALRRWGKAAGKQDAVDHAVKLLRGEL